MTTLVVDGANVVGSRPDGWWLDRPGAARRLHKQLVDGGLPDWAVILVLEGQAKRGVAPGQEGCVRTIHAAHSGDDAIVDEVKLLRAAGSARARGVVVVTADRELRDRVEAVGATVRGPGWLLDQL